MSPMGADYPKEQTTMQIDQNTIEFGPGFLMRYRGLMDAEEKSKAWEIAKDLHKALKEGKTPDREHNLKYEAKRDHELTIIGNIFSPLRSLNYVSGIVTYEDSEWANNLSSLVSFYEGILKDRIDPTFKKIDLQLGYTHKCIRGCGENEINKLYEFNSSKEIVKPEGEFVPKRFYASVCMLNQSPVHKLNAFLYDDSNKRKAKYTNPRDGFNIHLMVAPETSVLEGSEDSLEVITGINKYCHGPKDGRDLFAYKFGRDVYRLISKSIPEYYSTLNFNDDFALYSGEIWRLNELGDANKFHGIKTLN